MLRGYDITKISCRVNWIRIMFRNLCLARQRTLRENSVSFARQSAWLDHDGFEHSLRSDQNQKQNPVVLKVSSCTIVSSCPLVLDVAIWINPAQNSTSDHLTLTDFCHPCTGDRQDALINLNDPYETEHESDVSNSQKRRSH